MVSDEQIRAVCTKVAATVAAESNLEELEQLEAGLKMLCTEYIRERSIHLAYSNPFPLSEVRLPLGIRTGRKGAA
jgi:hypothetical protein